MSTRLALIMAGGGGTRLWPASTPTRPKQYLPDLPHEGATLLSATDARLGQLVAEDGRYVITTADQLPAVRQTLPSLGEQHIFVEPFGRNTAPCIAYAITQIKAQLERKGGAELSKEATLVILPADHHIADVAGFQNHLQTACEHAEQANCIVTLGIQATRPDTGYGYIERSEEPCETIGDASISVFPARKFVEKPDLKTAESYLQAGNYLWNAGIFIAPLARLEAEFIKHRPQMWEAFGPLYRALREGRSESEIQKASHDAYQQVQSEPLDKAIAEYQQDLRVVPADLGWSDLGTWEALAELLLSGKGDNAIHGLSEDVALIDCQETLVWNEDGKIGAVGLENMVVVNCGGRVLICPRNRAQDVRDLAKRLTRSDKS